MPPTTVWVVPHTHWDREWYQPFQTFRARLVDLVDDVLDLIDSEPEFAFTLDGQLATVDDYLEIRPDAEPRIRAAMAQGRLALGPWQTLLDEYCVSGETIVRNLQQGWRRAGELGRPMAVGYLPDMFGHVAQMPQILRRAGIDHAVVWRGVPAEIEHHAFSWVAPDGSAVRTEYLLGGYGNAAYLFDLPDRVDRKVAALHRRFGPFFGDDDLLAMIGTDHAMPDPQMTRLTAAVNDASTDYRLRIATLAEYIQETSHDGESLPRWQGEMRSGARANVLMGVTSLRRDAKAACGRAERLLERYAEPLAALYLPAGSRSPAQRLIELAWQRLVTNAAHDSACSCSVDEVVEQVLVRYAEARQLAEAAAGQALAALAAGVSPVASVVVNPSPTPRGDIVELDLLVPAEWDEVALDAGGGLLATQELQRAAPLLLADTMAGRDAPQIMDRMFGRQLFGRHLNRIHVGRVEQGRHQLVYEVDVHPDPAALDVEQVRAEVETAVAVAPDDDWDVRIVGRARRRVLAQVTAPALGRAALVPVEGTAVASQPVTADGERLTGDLLEVAAAPDGTLTLTDGGTVLRGVGRIVDEGDAGDSYNWAPVAGAPAVEEPAAVRVRVVDSGPLRAALTVERDYRWPLGLTGDLRRRSADTAPVTVVTTVELRAGEPFARVRITFDNPSRDHRVRFHLPLPGPVERSFAEGQFAVVERGLTAEGGHGEHPLPTFPARGFVAVDGVAMLLDHLTEYEVVGGRELALTLLRSTGTISRNVHPLRLEPAGPEIPIPGAQLLGPQEITFAVLPLAGGWQETGVLSAMERYQHPFMTAGGRGGDGLAPSRACDGLAIEGDNVVLSSLRRCDGRLELRLVCEQDAPATCTVRGDITAARDLDLLGRPGDDLPVSGGALRLDLQPWEIRTVALASKSEHPWSATASTAAPSFS